MHAHFHGSLFVILLYNFSPFWPQFMMSEGVSVNGCLCLACDGLAT